MMAKYVAQKFIAPSPDAQVIGFTLKTYLRSLRADDIAPILAKHGLPEIDPNQWYPMQRALDVQKDINDTNENVSEVLVAAGIQFAQDWSIPPETKTIADALHMLRQLSKQVDRCVPDGFGFTIQEVCEKHVRMFHNTPYDDHSVYGLLWGLVKRLKPQGNMFVVRIIENPDPEAYPGTCFEIKWGATQDEVE
jgi:hypothetical protein